MNYTRSDLVLADAAMNQMRNAIYHLIRFMKRENIKDINMRLQRIGKNIASTYGRYWLPNSALTKENLVIILKDIYSTIFKSKISIEVNFEKKILKILDNKCSLCKYNYPDIDVPGCEVLQGFLPNFINILNTKYPNEKIISVKRKEVSRSRAIGDSQCVQEFYISEK
ncbi:MAG: hypothetical protein KAX33_00510 [Candidatus Lokiarchaeota archaeon]|nr:hypothetical protein [Candidatus Lokiarchaeota archaeon]